ncbi:MAG: DUF1015 domain-containing protein [Gaiellales bacterium]
MPMLKPFRALRYDVRTAGALDTLVAPPWDVITPERLEGFVAASPNNVIRLIRPYEGELAGERLREWVDQGILVREERPAVWRIDEEYVGPDGRRRTRRGLVARVKLVPYDEGIVLPHERIFAAPAETRLKLLRATRTKLSPVLMLHGGPPAEPMTRPADLEARLDDTVTRLWRLDDPAVIEEAVASVQTPLVIADGHHRYDAALRFHHEDGTPETSHVLSVLVSTDDPGLEIFPTHRLAEGPVPPLNGAFRLVELDGSAEAAFARLADGPREHPAFVLVRPDAMTLAELTESPSDPLDRLDVAALDRLELSNVTFTPSLAEAAAAVESGRASAAFLVRAPTVREVEEIARAGRTMPEKSTYFYPKLLSGLLFSPFDE